MKINYSVKMGTMHPVGPARELESGDRVSV